MPHRNPSPKIFKTSHRCSFIELDPFGHMNTVYYLAHYIEHRFTGMREESGLDLKAIEQLPLVFVTKDLKIDFLRSIQGDGVFHIESYVSAWHEKECKVICKMSSEDGKLFSKCEFTFTCILKETKKPGPWPEGTKDLFFN